MARAKIVVATLLWKRHEIFRVWSEALREATHDLLDVEVLVAGSEGEQSRELVESFGFHYLETPNAPIGRKANLRLQACEALDPDYVILCGSDDIVSTKTFERYRELAEAGVDEVTIEDIYYLNSHTGEMAYSPGYVDHRRGEPVAPWRMVSRWLCDELKWKGWNEQERLFLDSHIYRRLSAIRHTEERLHLERDGLFVLDIKSQVNMTPWRMRPHYRPAPRTLLTQHLSIRLVRRLGALRGPITDTSYLGIEHLRDREA